MKKRGVRALARVDRTRGTLSGASVASPTLGKQSSAIRDGAANPVESSAQRSSHHWGNLDSLILDQLHEAVIATDSDANIVGGNSSALHLLGYSPEELIGQSFFVLFP